MKLFSTGRASRILSAALVVAGSGYGHYFYEQYATTAAPYTPIVEKFDLNALPGSKVRYYISASGPAKFAAGDSFPALVSEIRAAADVWNQVGSSALKLEYGGLMLAPPVSSTPYIVIEFSGSIPQGLYALSGPQAPLGALATAADGSSFYPIQHSRMLLPLDMSGLASYSELTFTTLVHEFGHTMGLQHTLSSSVMSTYVTTGSTRANPLGADDIAGISELYPAGNFSAGTGTVSGTVLYLGGTPANLASVTVIAPGMDAVSALTNPDGTYTIRGIPPGQYQVYVTALPPAFEGESGNDGITYPVGPDGATPLPPGAYFMTSFYPGTPDPSQATPVSVAAGSAAMGIDFTVMPMGALDVYGVRTYGYVTKTVAVPAPPFVISGAAEDTIEATGPGLLQNQQISPGLSMGVLGNDAAVIAGSARPYPAPYDYLAVDLSLSGQAPSGPQHMLFETPLDTYVLPAAFHLVANPPPSIASIASYTNRVLAIRGANFSPATRVFFDGVAGVVRARTANGTLIVVAPPAPGAYAANVVARHPDGQSSLFAQGSPAVYVYDNAAAPVLAVSPATLAPGGDTTVDVVGQNTDFADGVTKVGFGSSDALVKSVVVAGPNHLIVTVTAAPNTSIDTAQAINITNGLELIAPALGASVTLQGN